MKSSTYIHVLINQVNYIKNNPSKASFFSYLMHFVSKVNDFFSIIFSFFDFLMKINYRERKQFYDAYALCFRDK